MTIRLSTGLTNDLLDVGSLKSIFANAKLQYFTGAQPASPDDAPTGSLLLTIDNTTGLNFGVAATGKLPKEAAVWAGVAASTGTAGYFRLSSLANDTGAQSVTESRIDGSVGTFGADLLISSTALVTGATQTISQFELTVPAA